MQDNFYYKKESNAFFERWKKYNINFNPLILRKSKKEIYNFLKKNINITDKNVLEIGCFIGDLLYHLKKKNNCKVYGVEPSSKACFFSKKNYNLQIQNKTFGNSSFFLNNKKNFQYFDIIICDDILSWVGRDIILPCLAAIDWMVKINGYIFFRDFYPSRNFAVKNHHWPKNKIFNFKQKHGHMNFFLQTGKYEIVKNYVRIDKSYQTINSKNKESLIWSDCIIKKLKYFSHPIEKL